MLGTSGRFSGGVCCNASRKCFRLSEAKKAESQSRNSADKSRRLPSVANIPGFSWPFAPNLISCMRLHSLFSHHSGRNQLRAKCRNLRIINRLSGFEEFELFTLKLDAASGQHYHLSTLLGMLSSSGKKQERVYQLLVTALIGYGNHIRAQCTGQWPSLKAGVICA